MVVCGDLTFNCTNYSFMVCLSIFWEAFGLYVQWQIILIYTKHSFFFHLFLEDRVS